jgi:hypothetical protein
MQIVQRSLRRLKIEVGPEVQVLSGGLQPFLFRSASGTLVAQAHLPRPPQLAVPDRNVFPGLLVTVVSRDQGRTWSLWRPAEDQGEGPITEGGTIELSDGTIRIFNWIADGPSPDGVFTGTMWDTFDEWQTLQGPKPFRVILPQGKAGHDDGGRPYTGVTFHRSVLELPGGDLVAGIYCWFKEDNVPSSYEPKMNRFRCVLLRSSDRGESWHYVSTIACDPSVGEEGFNEPVLARISAGEHAGRIICLMRTGQKTSPIHQAHSDDEGRTWSFPRALELRGVDPDLIEMADGTLVCSFGHRVITEPPSPEHGNYLAFSTDRGETWSYLTHLPIEPHSGATRSTCYTSVREIEPGKLLVLFDVGWWGSPIRYVGQRIVRVHRM